MEQDLLKNLIARLSKHAFEAFIPIFFSTPGEPCEPFPEIGEGVFKTKLLDSYGGSIHAIYLLHFLPVEVFNHPREVITAEPSIIGKLQRIRDSYKGQVGQWGMVSPHLVPSKALNGVYFLNNFAGITENQCKEDILPRYEKTLRRFKLSPHILGVGCCDSFVERNPKGVEQALQYLLSEEVDGVRICLEKEQVSVGPFRCEKSLFAGVSRHAKEPYEPVLADALHEKEDALWEFRALIEKGAKESELEKFISAHYGDIFGPKYDRIETQLWLRFPQHDIAGKKRRLDVFLRNSVTNDWDLFEIKRPVKLTSSYRDAPVLAHEVICAIQQIKNYARILCQDTVKKRFASEGIEYYEPCLNLVIGKAPQIPLNQWRLLLSTCAQDLKILTFGELVKEMEMRLRDLYKITGVKTAKHQRPEQ